MEQLVEDDRLSLLSMTALVIYRLLDCQHNGRTRQHDLNLKRPLDRETTVMRVCITVGLKYGRRANLHDRSVEAEGSAI